MINGKNIRNKQTMNTRKCKQTKTNDIHVVTGKSLHNGGLKGRTEATRLTRKLFFCGYDYKDLDLQLAYDLKLL